MTSEVQNLLDQLNRELAPRFEVVRLLGEGKVARVFLAREDELRRWVAIKVLRPELARDEVAPLRFQREARAAAKITHPNVTSVYQVGRLQDGTPYLVMQYVEGGSLDERIEAVGPFSPDEARQVIHEVASAIDAAHRHGIVHRDVRPANVLWNAESKQTVLTDFGIAAVEPSADHTTRHLTRVGEVIMGDVTFVSPEQLTGEAVSRASDVYSLGGLACFVLTGKGPFEGRSAVDMAGHHLKSEPPDLSADGSVPRGLALLIKRCLAKNPAHRPSSADVSAATAPGALESGGALDVAGFWRALARRRMVQMLGAYAVAGWLLLQIVSQLVEMELFGSVAYRLTLGLFLVGFGAAAVLSWFHGEKGRQEMGRLEIALLGAIAVAAIVVSVVILT